MQELKFEELTTRQKIGMTMIALFNKLGDESAEYTLELIRKRSVGAIYINSKSSLCKEIIAAIREAADYPILIICDAEGGLGDYKIGRHNALGCTDSEELAYMFGKITAITARKMGFNVVCNPVLDMANGNYACGINVRAIGNDKHRVASLAAAEAQGMHDGGALVVGKHYPGSVSTGKEIDPHMAETASYETKEELLDYNLYPYIYLNDRGLLDGIMTGHSRFVNIDPDYPASLSKKLINVIREAGFDGFALTDALSMMGVVAKFGKTESKGLAIQNGNDLALTWCDNREGYAAMCECYDRGILTDEALDVAVKRVLEAQHKVFEMQPKYTEITDEDIKLFNKINADSVYAKTDDGLQSAISKEGRHYFVVLTPYDGNIKTNNDGGLDVDPNYNGWYRPQDVIAKIKKMFPNSTAFAINEFPTVGQNMRVLEDSVEYDDVIFVTFFHSQAYIGEERFTSRLVSLAKALQVTNRVSAVVHFGNPYVLEDLPHIPRLIIGTTSEGSLDSTFNVLVGDYPAKGALTYDVKFN